MVRRSGSKATRPCEVTIDLAAFRANLALARDLAGSREVIAVVKADAYGHGAEVIARTALAGGCTGLAVLTVPEGVALRAVGARAPILVLAGARDREEAEHAVRERLTPVLHGPEGLARIALAARTAGSRTPVHAEVDTGMRRMGLAPESAVAFLQEVAQNDSLELEGVFTHFARADEADLTHCHEQIRRFREVLGAARERGIAPRQVHAANSAALLAGKPLAEALPEATAVRPGLMLYGVQPAPHLGAALRPVMTFRASVLALRDVAAGEAVGYGATYRAPAGGARIATLSVGYADGVPWSAANRGRVSIGGEQRPIVGRVSMDSICVELGPASGPGGELASRVELGDEAILFGDAASGGISVEQAAEDAGTLSYELLVRVGARVPRIVVAD